VVIMSWSLLQRFAAPHRADVDAAGRIVAHLSRRVSTFVVLGARLSGVSVDPLPP